MRPLAFFVIACGALALPKARSAENGPGPVREAFFRPIDIGDATLSPDGRHLAYSTRTSEGLQIVIVDVDDPSQQQKINAGPDAVEQLSGDRHATPTRLTFLRWARPGRLIIGVDTSMTRHTYIAPDLPVVPSYTEDWKRFQGAVFAVDADGKNIRLLADPTRVTEERRVFPNPALPPAPITLLRNPRAVALPLDEPNIVVVEAHGTPSSHGIFRINTETGRSKSEEHWQTGELLFGKAGEPVLVHEKSDPAREIFYRLWNGKTVGRRVALDGELAAQPPLNFHISPENYLGPRSIPLGSDYDPNLLYFASNVGRDTYGIYALNLQTKQRTSFSVEHPGFDLADLQTALAETPLVFDRSRRQLVGIRYADVKPRTIWRDPELAGLQAELDAKFSGQSVEMLEWSDDRSRLLLRFSSRSDPGRYGVLLRKPKRLQEIARRASWIDPDTTHASTSFAFTTPQGARLTGYLTVPRKHHLSPPALIIKLHDGPWERDLPDFDAEAQAIAGMGFVVAQVNYRGSAGFGSTHRDAIKQGIDTVPLADVLATVDWVIARTKVDAKRVALVGRGFGGFLAIRALQLHPERFRSAIAINAPTNLSRWISDREIEEENGPQLMSELRRQLLGQDRARLQALSPISAPEKITQPLLLVKERNNRDVQLHQATSLRNAARKYHDTVEVLEVSDGFGRNVPADKAQVFSKIQDFLYLSLYDANVQLGAPRVKE